MSAGPRPRPCRTLCLWCAYNSCRNRHWAGPKCQGLARAQWLEDRQAELLPASYFHVVFTLPAPVTEIALSNKPWSDIEAASSLRDRRGSEAAPRSSLPCCIRGVRHFTIERMARMDRLSARLLLARARARPSLSALVHRKAGGSLCRRRAPLRRRAASPSQPPSRGIDPRSAAIDWVVYAKRSPDQSRSSNISAASPIASPSPIIAWSAWMTTDG